MATRGNYRVDLGPPRVAAHRHPSRLPFQSVLDALGQLLQLSLCILGGCLSVTLVVSVLCFPRGCPSAPLADASLVRAGIWFPCGAMS